MNENKIVYKCDFFKFIFIRSKFQSKCDKFKLMEEISLLICFLLDSSTGW